jgi:hypothetical protein
MHFTSKIPLLRARASMNALTEIFKGRIIVVVVNIIIININDLWPAYSLDLNPCEFYVWGTEAKCLHTKLFHS